ncbi:replication initiation protein [Campylobacter magnus]|uniref:replication initiation protein n=1 Tax=Campylobacter magnus TaxID=3026462 RepID=UPI0026E0E052|nr:replication initiation protein [Campylobacter magnus]MDO2408459.1 replication initiation protein [Campylobacter magnus]
MPDIVKYHNDLNKLKFYLFGELEQNILMGVFLNARFHNTKEFILNADDIAKFLPQRNPSKQEIFNRVMSLRENLFKIDYTHEIKLDNGLVELSFYNIFSVFTLVYTTENREFEYLKIKISDDFSYLIHNLTKFMTQFELEEFLFLSGKYTKALYIHLKQFRTTGVWRVSWDNFKELLGIPSNYRMCDIDLRILKPSVAQLQEPLNLFERSRTPFKNLKYTKIKGKGRGRGGAVVAIEFTFDKQTAQGEHITHFMGQEIAPSQAKEYKEPRKLEPIFIQKLMDLAKKKGEIVYFGKWYHLHNFIKNDKKITLCLSRQKSIFNGFYADITLAQAEQLAKNNNLI